MSQTLEKLEQRIRELFGRVDRLHEENASFRRAALGRGDEVTSQQALEQIELLKRENDKLCRKLADVDKHLQAVLTKLEKPE
jgi:FtsZ-binding cell division protein ZapB